MTEKYMIWDGEKIEGLADLGLSRVMTEVSATGNVLREIGFDKNDKVVYRFPGQGSFGDRGLFDNATVSTSQLASDLTVEEFDALFEEKS